MTEPLGAEAGDSSVEPVAADTYGPYGQLIRMLLPRSGSIAVYDARTELLWCSDGYEQPDLRRLVDALSDEGNEYLSNRGVVRATEGGAPAFLYALRGQMGQVLGSVVVELPEGQSNQSASMVASLLRPVLDCLENRIDLERTAVDQDKESTADIDILLALDHESDEQTGALERLVRHSVEHLDCALGALVIPEKNITICCADDPASENQGPALLSRTHKHLLAWVQLNNRPMVVNRVAPESASDLPPYKILSCPVRDPNNRVTGLFGLFRAADAADFELRDIRMLEFMSRKAVSALHSQYDGLTGLLNRLAFERRVQALFDRPSAASAHALVHLDVDKLHVINSAFGFQAGDEVIRRVAELLREHLRPEDLAGRLGGDRFAVLLAGQSSTEARVLADRVRETMSALGYLNGEQTVPVSLSAGIAACASDCQPVAHVMAAAELACKRAKDGGRNRIEVYEEDDAGLAARRGQVYAFAHLQDALKSNNFRLDLQKIVPICESSESLGYEVLIRMRNGDGDLVAPDKFIGAAERYQLMPALDRWVVCSALELLEERNEDLVELSARFALNISAQSLTSTSFLEFLTDQLGKAHVHPQLLCFEIRESAAVGNMDEVARFIEAVTELGCSFALDDFGCGLSSLAHLKRLPVQYLKIDGSFIRALLDDPYAESMVVAVAQAAKALGVKTVAEHVETEDLATKLRQIGVDYGQGFFYHRPEAMGRVLKELFSPQRSVRVSAQ